MTSSEVLVMRRKVRFLGIFAIVFGLLCAGDVLAVAVSAQAPVPDVEDVWGGQLEDDVPPVLKVTMPDDGKIEHNTTVNFLIRVEEYTSGIVEESLTVSWIGEDYTPESPEMELNGVRVTELQHGWVTAVQYELTLTMPVILVEGADEKHYMHVSVRDLFSNKATWKKEIKVLAPVPPPPAGGGGVGGGSGTVSKDPEPESWDHYGEASDVPDYEYETNWKVKRRMDKIAHEAKSKGYNLDKGWGWYSVRGGRTLKSPKDKARSQDSWGDVQSQLASLWVQYIASGASRSIGLQINDRNGREWFFWDYVTGEYRGYKGAGASNRYFFNTNKQMNHLLTGKASKGVG
jgi:hypothetical protein